MIANYHRYQLWQLTITDNDGNIKIIVIKCNGV